MWDGFGCEARRRIRGISSQPRSATIGALLSALWLGSVQIIQFEKSVGTAAIGRIEHDNGANLASGQSVGCGQVANDVLGAGYSHDDVVTGGGKRQVTVGRIGIDQ